MLKSLKRTIHRYPRISFLTLAFVAGLLSAQYLAQIHALSGSSGAPAPSSVADSSIISDEMIEQFAYTDDPQLLSAVHAALDANAETFIVYGGSDDQDLITNGDSTDGKRIIAIESLLEETSAANQDIVSTNQDVVSTSQDVVNASSAAAAVNQPSSSGVQPILDIPLDAEVQRRTLDEVCHGDLKEFCLLMSIGYWETRGTFIVDLIGDEGLSYGLYQMNTKWHTERTIKLGYTIEDLFDPVICAEVSLDYLHELMDTYQDSRDVTHFLYMLYNMGPSSAKNAIKHSVYSTAYSRAAMEAYLGYLAEVGLA